MKTFKLIALFWILFSAKAFAQMPKVIEADLLRLFLKIDYNALHNTQANDLFGKKLKYYTEKYPSTINQNFETLKKARLDISTTDDGRLRIYSWDTWTGGTMHFFENVFQYKAGARVISVLDTPKSDADNRPNYNKLYSFVNNSRTYYLAAYLVIGSSKDVGNGISIFTIENAKLIDAKIIKTKTGLHSHLDCEYDFGSVMDWKIRPSIVFDPQSKTIILPLVDDKGNVTHKFITYKFTGQYFEKVKN